MKARYRYRENRYRYGDYQEVNVYPVFDTYRSSRRSSKRRPSRKCQERLNQLNAERELARVIPANFTEDDLSMVLTFDREHWVETISDARRQLTNFFRRLNRARRRASLERAKYIYSIEQGTRTRRIHIHLILTGGLTLKEIAKLWGRGYVDRVKPLIFDDTGIRGLARYFCKQQVSDKGEAYAKRYQCSQNCVHPKPSTNDSRYSKRRVRQIAEAPDDLRAPEKLYPGYYCTEITRFYNDVDGMYYITMMFRRYPENSEPKRPPIKGGHDRVRKDEAFQ